MTSEVAEILLPHLMGEPSFVGYYDVDSGEYVRRSDIAGEVE
jgi:hypothetical protein